MNKLGGKRDLFGGMYMGAKLFIRGQIKLFWGANEIILGANKIILGGK